MSATTPLGLVGGACRAVCARAALERRRPYYRPAAMNRLQIATKPRRWHQQCDGRDGRRPGRAAPKAAPGRRANSANRSARAASSPFGKVVPQGPMASGRPPLADPTTAQPHAMPSRATMPNGFRPEGWHDQNAAIVEQGDQLSPSQVPTKSIWLCSPCNSPRAVAVVLPARCRSRTVVVATSAERNRPIAEMRRNAPFSGTKPAKKDEIAGCVLHGLSDGRHHRDRRWV